MVFFDSPTNWYFRKHTFIRGKWVVISGLVPLERKLMIPLKQESISDKMPTARLQPYMSGEQGQTVTVRRDGSVVAGRVGAGVPVQ